MNPARVKRELARVVLHLREEAGLTQAELGRRSGLDGSTISLIETGKLEPGLTTFLGLAEGLGVDGPGLLLQVCELAESGRPMEESWRRDAKATITGR